MALGGRQAEGGTGFVRRSGGEGKWSDTEQGAGPDLGGPSAKEGLGKGGEQGQGTHGQTDLGANRQGRPRLQQKSGFLCSS